MFRSCLQGSLCFYHPNLFFLVLLLLTVSPTSVVRNMVTRGFSIVSQLLGNSSEMYQPPSHNFSLNLGVIFDPDQFDPHVYIQNTCHYHQGMEAAVEP